MKKRYLTLSLAAFAFALTGCEFNGKVTGGGSMDGANGGKANFGFKAEQCINKDGDFEVNGNFNYHDMDMGVKLHGDVTNAGLCDSFGDVIDGGSFCQLGCFDGEHEVQFDYVSKNPKIPGEGSGLACVSDGGEGTNVGDGTFGTDSVFITVFSGPYAGYQNFQTDINGNIQDHACPEEQGNGGES